MSLEDLNKEELFSYAKELEEKLKRKTKYGLVWEDKSEDIVLECENKYPILKNIKERSIRNDKNGPVNVLIEGDNYHALQILNYTHKGKVDVIYIDPPYNTGSKDFIYNDIFIDNDDGYRHSKWLSFMERRLKLAKELLKDTGIIFISIDDNEQAQLKLLCDGVFGDKNFITNYVWHNNVKGRQMDLYIKNTYENILVYSKDVNSLEVNKDGDTVDVSKLERDDISYYKKDYPLHNGTADFHINNRPNLAYSIYYNEKNNNAVVEDEKIGVNNLVIGKPLREDLLKKGYVRIIPKYNDKYNNQRVWRWGKEKFLREYKTELLFVNEGGDFYIYQKKRFGEDGGYEKKFKNYLNIDGGVGKNELLNILGTKIFNNPKPSLLIKSLLEIFTHRDSTILDFFAGSGTTGHAVLELNKEDGGNRQFILVTNNGDEKSEHKIAENITYERLNRVMNGYVNKKDEKVEGLGGNLEYLKCDFVKRSKHTDNLKLNIVNYVTDIISLRENTFEHDVVKKQDGEVVYKIMNGVIGNLNHSTAVYYDLDDSYIESMKKDLEEKTGTKSAYIFSLSNPIDLIDDYSAWSKIRIEEMPNNI